MAVQKADYIWRNFEVDGVSASGFHKPVLGEQRAWGTWVEQMVGAGLSNGGLIYDTKASMDADLAHDANASAWVMTGADAGIYRKSGASGSGAWAKIASLPYSYIKAANVGAGTANAIQATTDIPVPAADGAALIALPVAVDNTASPVTVSINGGAALTVKTAAGNDVAPGGLKAGMIVSGYVSGSTFRMLSDQASAAIQAAAEEASAAAKAERIAAETAKSGAETAKQEAETAAAEAVVSKTQAELAALAAGAKIFISASDGIAGTAPNDIFVVSTAAGGQVYENQAGSAVMIGWLGKAQFGTVGGLLAFTGTLGPAGVDLEADGYRYSVAPPTASDQDLVTAGGVKLYVNLAGRASRAFFDDHSRDFRLVAHRGREFGPENTVAGLMTLPSGVYAVEVDARKTSDNQFLLLHDETVDRTTDGSGALSGMSFDAARALDAGGAQYPGEKIPTITEILAAANDRGIRYTLIHTYGVATQSDADQIISEITSAHSLDRVILMAVDGTQATYCRNAHPDVLLGIFGGTTSNVADRIRIATELGACLLLSEPGDAGFTANKSIYPLIRRAGIVPGASYLNSSRLMRECTLSGACFALTDYIQVFSKYDRRITE